MKTIEIGTYFGCVILLLSGIAYDQWQYIAISMIIALCQTIIVGERLEKERKRK